MSAHREGHLFSSGAAQKEHLYLIKEVSRHRVLIKSVPGNHSLLACGTTRELRLEFPRETVKEDRPCLEKQGLWTIAALVSASMMWHRHNVLHTEPTKSPKAEAERNTPAYSFPFSHKQA